MVCSDEQGRQRTGWSGGGRRAGIALIGAAVLALGAAALATGATSKGYGTSLGSFKTHNLVSDQAGKADVMDKSLVNAWGLSFGEGKSDRESSPRIWAPFGVRESLLFLATGEYRGPIARVRPATAETGKTDHWIELS